MSKRPHLEFDRKDMIGAWVAAKTGQDTPWGNFYAMGIMHESSVQAGVVFNNFNESNCLVHIAIQKPTKLIIPLFCAVCDYAFNMCKLKRITGMVPTDEPEVIAFDKHLGFREEFVMKDAANNSDMQVLVLTPTDATRWLENEHGKKVARRA
jgi:hypothetical protein